MLRPAFVALLASCPVLVASPAQACSIADCSGGHLLPASGSIPPNTPALVWVPRERQLAEPRSAGDLRLMRVDGGAAVEVAFSIEHRYGQTLIIPDSQLPPGAQFKLEAEAFCDYDGNDTGEPTRAAFETAPAEHQFPSKLGSLVADRHCEGPLQVESSASCRKVVDAAQIRVEIELSPGAAPWANMLHYSTTVDGEAWAPQHRLGENIAYGSSWEGRAVDRLYTRCDGRTHTGLSEGTHRVQMHASLPGTNIVLSTNEVEVMLSCDDVAPDNISDASCDEALFPETNMPEEEAEAPDMQSSCRLATTTSQQWPLLLVALIWLFGRGRALKALQHADYGGTHSRHLAPSRARFGAR